MKVMTWESIFGPVTGKRNHSHSLGTPFAEWRTLEEDTYFDGIGYARGSRFKAFESANFGNVVFAQDTLTPEGNTPEKLIHRF